jgi:hypothetical protein
MCIPVTAIARLEGRQRRVDVVVEYIRMAEIIGFDAAMVLRRLLKKTLVCAEKYRLIRPRRYVIITFICAGLLGRSPT